MLRLEDRLKVHDLWPCNHEIPPASNSVPVHCAVTIVGLWWVSTGHEQRDRAQHLTEVDSKLLFGLLSDSVIAGPHVLTLVQSCDRRSSRYWGEPERAGYRMHKFCL